MRLAHILLLLILPVAVFAQRNTPLSLTAWADWKKTNIPCGDLLYIDTLGFVCFTSGCEGKANVLINRYTLNGDTIKVLPFDFLSEDVFLKIFRTPSGNPEQQVEFYGAEGKPFKGNLDSSFLIKLITGRKDKWVDQTGSHILKIPRGQYAGMEIQQLEKIFGVPVPFWIDRNYDYKIQINVPAFVLNNLIVTCSNFKSKYLLINKNTIRFQGKTLKIGERRPATTPSPSF